MSWSNFVFALLTIVLCIIISFLVYISRRNFDYWKKRNVPHLKPLPFFGNFKDHILFKTYYPLITQRICQQFPDSPYVGAFFGTEPTLIIQDPELIKVVLTKDFYYFNGREISNYTQKEIATQNLFFTYGDRWRLIRQNLTPLFSSAKLKKMFLLVKTCTITLDSWLSEMVKESSTLDSRNIFAAYTMDSIGNCFFGVKTNTMSQNHEVNPFKIVGNKIFHPTKMVGFKNVYRSIWPKIFYGLRFRFIEEDVTDFFHKLLTDVFASRQYEPTDRHDFVDFILSLKKANYVTGDSITNLKTGENEKISLKVTDDFMVSNCVVMFAAGFETSSSTINFTLYELAKNKDARKKAINEVDRYWLNCKEISYESLNELPYLNACIDETLRLYPVLAVITREVMEDYTLPTGVHLDKGVRVHIPVYHLHHDPNNFPDPEEYRPERFYGETKQYIKPYTYIPFGEGPRICIGMRFAKIQMLACLVTVLRKYSVEVAEGMPATLHFEARGMTTQPKEIIRLKFISRTENQ